MLFEYHTALFFFNSAQTLLSNLLTAFQKFQNLKLGSARASLLFHVVWLGISSNMWSFMCIFYMNPVWFNQDKIVL